MNVLVVEDNPDDVAAVRRIAAASGLGVELLAIADGRAAIAHLERVEGAAAVVPDLMLLDLGLPAVHGLDVLGWLKQRPLLREIPVVLLSASERDDDVQRGVRLGAHSHVVKPISGRDFRWIAGSIARWRSRLTRLGGAGGKER